MWSFIRATSDAVARVMSGGKSFSTNFDAEQNRKEERELKCGFFNVERSTVAGGYYDVLLRVCCQV
jgi:hypothetical protein